MPKYRIPIEVISYTEVEADNLLDAINDVNKGTPDIEGVNPSFIEEWQIDNYHDIIKDDGIVLVHGSDYDSLLFADVYNEKDLKKY